MPDVLNVEARQSCGTRASRRLRRGGRIPAVFYGQGDAPVSLSVAADALHAAVRHGPKLVQLDGALSESALIRELQWDSFGLDVLHVDFLRVQTDQRITMTVQLQLRGEAPGAKEGGIVEQLTREVEIEVLAAAIPEMLHVNINGLNLGQSLAVAAVEDLPAEATLVTDPESIAVHCVEPIAVAEEAEPVDLAAEPELIGGKADDEAPDAAD